MPTRVFPYEPKHRDALNNVRSMVYRGGDPIRPDEDILASDMSATLVEVDGAIVGSATGLHFNTVLNGKVAHCAGVAAVGIVPEARRSGAGFALMEGANRQYLEEGFEFASLFPFRASYYRQFGYEYAGTRHKLTVPERRLPQLGHELCVRPLDASDWLALEPCYNDFAQRYNGMNLRNELQWRRALGMDKPFAVFVAGDPIEAYAMVRLDGGFWVSQEIRELVWSTPRGYRSMLGFLKGLAQNKNELSWFEPIDSPYRNSYGERDVQIASDQWMMWRAIDVPRALEYLQCEGGPAEWTVRVVDKGLPENEGPWRVVVGAEGAAVEPGATADFTIPVGTLSQLLLGDPGAEAALACGLVEVHNPSAVPALLRSAPTRRVFCLEYF